MAAYFSDSSAAHFADFVLLMLSTSLLTGYALQPSSVRRAIPMILKLLAVAAVVSALAWMIVLVCLYAVLDGWEFNRFVLSPRNLSGPILLAGFLQVGLGTTRAAQRSVRDIAP